MVKAYYLAFQVIKNNTRGVLQFLEGGLNVVTGGLVGILFLC